MVRVFIFSLVLLAVFIMGVHCKGKEPEDPPQGGGGRGAMKVFKKPQIDYVLVRNNLTGVNELVRMETRTSQMMLDPKAGHMTEAEPSQPSEFTYVRKKGGRPKGSRNKIREQPYTKTRFDETSNRVVAVPMVNPQPGGNRQVQTAAPAAAGTSTFAINRKGVGGRRVGSRTRISKEDQLMGSTQQENWNIIRQAESQQAQAHAEAQAMAQAHAAAEARTRALAQTQARYQAHYARLQAQGQAQAQAQEQARAQAQGEVLGRLVQAQRHALQTENSRQFGVYNPDAPVFTGRAPSGVQNVGFFNEMDRATLQNRARIRTNNEQHQRVDSRRAPPPPGSGSPEEPDTELKL